MFRGAFSLLLILEIQIINIQYLLKKVFGQELLYSSLIINVNTMFPWSLYRVATNTFLFFILGFFKGVGFLVPSIPIIDGKASFHVPQRSNW